MDKLELEVQVTDENGSPLAGAMVWYTAQPLRQDGGVSLGKTDVERMAKRYGGQSDFLTSDDIPETVFNRTGLEGRYRLTQGLLGASKPYHYVVVGAKRGYLPMVESGEAPPSVHVISLRLHKDARFKPNPRMEEFDRLIAEAGSMVPGEDPTGDARMHRLQSLSKRLRDLAQTLENEDRKNDASAVYWALADFPEVIRTVGSGNSPSVIGYRHGQSAGQSEQDRLRATMLNDSVPKLLISRALVEKGFNRVGINSLPQGKAYLDAFDNIYESPRRDQLLPKEFRVAIRQAIRWKMPDRACRLVQAAYAFEPTTLSHKSWQDTVSELEKLRIEMKLAPLPCRLLAVAPSAL